MAPAPGTRHSTAMDCSLRVPLQAPALRTALLQRGLHDGAIWLDPARFDGGPLSTFTRIVAADNTGPPARAARAPKQVSLSVADPARGRTCIGWEAHAGMI